jgi:hypothetical protein
MTNVVSIAPVISNDVAESEFVRWAEAMRLDFEPKGMSQEDLEGFADNKYKFIKALNNGSLVINAEGVAEFTPASGGNPISFHQPRGTTLMATDERKAGHNHAKQFAALAEMCRQPPTRFSAMPLYDLRVCNAIFNLFLGSK